MFEEPTVRNDKFHCSIIDRIGLVHAGSAVSTTTKIYCELGRSWGIVSISPKAASEKSQTTVSENKYTSLKIDVFRTLTFRTPTAYLRYSLTVSISPNVYAV